MTTIYKYPCPPHEFNKPFTIEMPWPAKILHVGLQCDVPTIWALVDPECTKVPRMFQLIPTGVGLDPEVGHNYLGTVQLSNGLVFHIHEVFR